MVSDLLEIAAQRRPQQEARPPDYGIVGDLAPIRPSFAICPVISREATREMTTVLPRSNIVRPAPNSND